MRVEAFYVFRGLGFGVWWFRVIRKPGFLLSLFFKGPLTTVVYRMPKKRHIYIYIYIYTCVCSLTSSFII